MVRHAYVCKAMSAPWYTSWFDNPYYLLLYQDRDESEAKHFLDNLLTYLQATRDQLFLDVCCGRGRHARYLHALGYDVHGIDLSAKSIEHAEADSDPSLHFEVHDIRKPFGEARYDHVLNLFTSFGYFSNDQEHIRSLSNVYRSLIPGGTFTLDYLNIHALELPKGPSIKTVEGTRFVIEKEVKDGVLVKDIRFITANGRHHFQERVRAFEKDELEAMLNEVGFRIKAIFGDYDLMPFKMEGSERLIFVCTK